MDRIECWGFLFRQKKNPRHIDKEKVKSFEIPDAMRANVPILHGQIIMLEYLDEPEANGAKKSPCEYTL